MLGITKSLIYNISLMAGQTSGYDFLGAGCSPGCKGPGNGADTLRVFWRELPVGLSNRKR
jgi:hypothetical protein